MNETSEERNSMQITIEQVEALASQLETEESERRTKLCRLIAAHARIVGVRDPSAFRRMPTEQADEDGHYDNSYPPKVVYKDYTGPRAIEIYDTKTSDVATSSGFYYEWRRVTEDRGLWVTRAGGLLGCEESGTGRLGQFAAHPGDCNVQVTLDWVTLDPDDVTIEALEQAEKKMRALAFPASQSRVA